jgi:hypothetical protein
MYLTEPLEPRAMTLVHALGNFAVVTLHVTSPGFRFNSGLFSVNLDGRVTGTRHTPVLAASKPPACQALSGEAEDSLSWCPFGSRDTKSWIPSGEKQLGYMGVAADELYQRPWSTLARYKAEHQQMQVDACSGFPLRLRLTRRKATCRQSG